jgi:hypothetical protein
VNMQTAHGAIFTFFTYLDHRFTGVSVDCDISGFTRTTALRSPVR